MARRGAIAGRSGDAVGHRFAGAWIAASLHDVGERPGARVCGQCRRDANDCAAASDPCTAASKRSGKEILMIRTVLSAIVVASPCGAGLAQQQTRPTTRTTATPSIAPTTATCGSTAAPARCRSAPGGPSGWPCQAVPDERARAGGARSRGCRATTPRSRRSCWRATCRCRAWSSRSRRHPSRRAAAAAAERCRAQPGDDLRRKGLAPPGRDDRHPAEGHAEKVMTAVRRSDAVVDRRLSAITA